MTTIRDIAREAGFSVSTVSRVLAGHRDVSESTAATVQAVIDKRQFSVNRNARNLKQSGTTPTVLAVVKGRRNMLFASMLEQVQTAVTATGLTVATQYLDEDRNEVADAERFVREIKPRGVVFLGGNAEHLASHARLIGEECPAVVLTNSVAGLGLSAISSVTTDDQAAGRAAVEHLLGYGHRRIGVIGGSPELSSMPRNRREGVLQAMSDHGLDFDPAQYVDTRFSLSSGFRAAQRLIDQVPGITAIYAMSDIMALGALRGLYERGMRVPDDISLIGHDGIEMSSYVVPKLVTIRQPEDVMATRGVEILMRHIDGDPTPVDEVVDFEILAGESVRSLEE